MKEPWEFLAALSEYLPEIASISGKGA